MVSSILHNLKLFPEWQIHQPQAAWKFYEDKSHASSPSCLSQDRAGPSTCSRSVNDSTLPRSNLLLTHPPSGQEAGGDVCSSDGQAHISRRWGWETDDPRITSSPSNFQVCLEEGWGPQTSREQSCAKPPLVLQRNRLGGGTAFNSAAWLLEFTHVSDTDLLYDLKQVS